MELTEKCKESFEKWLKTEMYYLGKESLSDLFWNALIVEFFDSVGIYIEIGFSSNHDNPNQLNWSVKINDKTKFGNTAVFCKSGSDRNYATSVAIKYSNQIFNERK